MSNKDFPPGWNQDRVEKLLAHYEQMDDDVMVAEDEAASELSGQTLMVVPTQYVPAVRELIERKTSA